jgi:DNA-directed RNA polymerase subunit RPC12/RpoP
MATATTFKCANCGAGIEINENMTVCPYCNFQYWVEEDHTESIRASVKEAEAVMVKNIHDIKIPAVVDKIKKIDIAEFKKLNESMALLEKERNDLWKRIDTNKRRIEELEHNIGVGYTELTDRRPKFKFKVLRNIVVWGYIAAIIAKILRRISADTLFIAFAAIPAAYILLVVLAKIIYLITLKGRQRKLDSKRIIERESKLKENIKLTAEHGLIKSSLYEFMKIKSASAIYDYTDKFGSRPTLDDPGEPADVSIGKVDYALSRMKNAKIDFDLACSGYNAETAAKLSKKRKKQWYGDFFKKVHTDQTELINLCINHLK